MLKINKKTISLTRGDNASIRLRPRYDDEERTEYVAQEGDRVIFRMKVKNQLIEKECNISLENNRIVVSFIPQDTIDLDPGVYRYEAELITSWAMHYTFLQDQTFILTKELERRLESEMGSSHSGNDDSTSEIDGELNDDNVVDGDLQPTNPSLDYDVLENKPRLNGVVIKGSKTNADYGIPTKTSDLDNDSDFVSDDEYVHTDNNYDDTDKGKVDALGTASTYDVAESGNASTTQVVKGDDTRLTDARTPVAHQHSKFDITDFPTNVSAFNNDSGYITNAVNTLINYYLKSETYTKTEVEQLIAAIKQGKFEVVETLPVSPDPNVIYLVPKDPTQTSNAYDEYVYINNAWEKIGDTDIDLSDYVTDEELTTALQNYVTTSAFQTAIANYYTKTETDNMLSNKVDKVSGKGLSTNDYDNTAKGIVDGVTTALAGKVDKVNGKGLSTEDYTTAEKTKLAAISDEANKVTSSSTNGHINIDGVDTTVYDDTVVTTAISGLNENVEDIQDELSVDTATVEGNPINFTTKSAQTAQSTIIDLEPIQDLHGYDKPWAGGAGKNKWSLGDINVESESGISFNLPAGTYTVQCDLPTSSTRLAIRFVYGDSTNILVDAIYLNNPKTFTLEKECVSINTFISNFTSGLVAGHIQIESGSTATSYEPYENECPISGRTEIGILGTNGKESTDPDYEVSNDLTISLGQTVHGGQIDLEKGECVVDKGIIVVDGINISFDAKGGNLNVDQYYLENVPNAYLFGLSSSWVPVELGNQYQCISNQGDYVLGSSANAGYSIYISNNNKFQPRLSFPLSMGIDTLAKANTYAQSNPIQFIYPLATPTTITLTPNAINLLKGSNYITTDGDKITLTYRTGEVATLGDLKEQIAESQILTDTATGDKYRLIVTNGVLSVQQISN